MKKRVLTLALTMAMLLGLLPGFAGQSAQAANEPSGLWTSVIAVSHSKNVETVTYNGQTCYAIKTADDLAWFAKAVQSAKSNSAAILSANIVLMDGIDLSAHYWTPIYHHTGESFSWVGFQSNYKGSIYGNNHKISGLYLAPLEVDYTFKADNSTYESKKGDIWHNDQYGFVVTKGSVKGLVFDGVFFDRAIAGKGKMDDKVGKNQIVYDTYNTIFVYAETEIRNIEIMNATFTSNLNVEDILQPVGSSDKGLVWGVYFHDSTITSIGNGSTYLVEAYYKTVKHTVVDVNFTSEEKDYSCVWGGDAKYSTMEYNYTNVDLTQFQSEELTGKDIAETKPEEWFTVENICAALGGGWSISGGELKLGPAEKKQYDVWTAYASATAPAYDAKTKTYSIGTAEELAWFAKAVQEADADDDILSANVKLTANIDLSAHYWTPIYRYSGNKFSWVAFDTLYKGSFDGDYHVIKGLKLAPIYCEYTFEQDDNAYKTKAGDIWENDEYGFIVTKGAVQNLKFDGVKAEIENMGFWNTADAGNYNIVYKANSLLCISADSGIKSIEITGLDIDANMGNEDMIYILAAADAGKYESAYINGGSVNVTGTKDAATWMIDAYMKLAAYTIVKLDELNFVSTEWTGIWSADPVDRNSQPELLECYTNIDYKALNLCDYQGEIMDESWFTGENVYDVLSASGSEAWVYNERTGECEWVNDPHQLVGDVNGDGEVDLLDFTLLRTIVAEGGTPADYPNADLDNDGQIGIKDILMLWDYLKTA